MTPYRKGSLGCFGVLCVFALIVFTVGNGFLLTKMNPRWFDRHAFWKGPLLEPEPVILASTNGPPRDANWLAEQQRNASLYQRPRDVDTHQFKWAKQASVRQTVTPNAAAVVDSQDGCKVDLPAGAVAQTVEATITPVVELPASMAGPMAGPVYGINLGQGEHYQFSRPVTITLGYLPSAAKSQPVTAAFWNRDHWEPVPSTVDPKTGTVTAQVTHASLWTTLVPGITPVFAGKFALMSYIIWNVDKGARGLDWLMKQYGMTCLRTQNFAIYYYVSSANNDPCPPSDIGYQGRNGRPVVYNAGVSNPSKPVPLFVQDIARYCEWALPAVQSTGLNLPSVGVTDSRYNVFILDCGGMGESKAGGPVLISNGLATEINGTKISIEAGMRSIVAHELAHVMQLDYFGYWKPSLGDQSRPFIEATAQYLGDRLCDEGGFPANVTRDYYLTENKGRLWTVPIDQMTGNEHYAFARFFQWLDKHHNDAGKRAVIDLVKSGTPTIEQLAKSVDKAVGGQNRLPDLYRAFAIEFYHFGIFKSDFAPLLQGKLPNEQIQHQTSACNYPKPASVGARVTPTWDQAWSVMQSQAANDPKVGHVALELWSIVLVPKIDPLTSQAFYVSVPTTLKSRRPKVVIDLSVGYGKSLGGLTGDAYSAKVGPTTLPVGAATGETFNVSQKGRNLTGVVAFGTKDLNRASLLVHNPSFKESVQWMTVARYLLLAPSWCTFSREGDPNTLQGKRWTIIWHQAELEPHTDVFGGYNIYRKKLGEPDTSYVKVAEGQIGQVYTDKAPDENNYVYTVKVCDKLGNESEGSPDAPDPFIGKWEGEIQLVKGSLVEDFIRETEKLAGELDAKQTAKINALPANEQAQARQEWQTQKTAAGNFASPIKQMVLKAEGILKVGVPVEFQIRQEGGEYRLLLTESAYYPTGMTVQHEVALVRTSRDTLRLKTDVYSTDDTWQTLQELGVKPPELALTRSPPSASTSTMRNSAQEKQNYVIPSAADGRFQGAELKWWAERKDANPPPKVLTATEGFMVDFDKELQKK